MATCLGMCTHATWPRFTGMNPGLWHEWFMRGVVKCVITWPGECSGHMCMDGRHHVCIGDDHGWPPLGVGPLLMCPAVSRGDSHSVRCDGI